jgi:hypothetical protein
MHYLTQYVHSHGSNLIINKYLAICIKENLQPKIKFPDISFEEPTNFRFKNNSENGLSTINYQVEKMCTDQKNSLEKTDKNSLSYMIEAIKVLRTSLSSSKKYLLNMMMLMTVMMMMNNNKKNNPCGVLAIDLRHNLSRLLNFGKSIRPHRPQDYEIFAPRYQHSRERYTHLWLVRQIPRQQPRQLPRQLLRHTPLLLGLGNQSDIA